MPGEKTRAASNVLAQSCALITTALGLVALLGWLFDLRRLSSVNLDWMPMAPSTALLFVLLGFALFVRARLPGSHMVRLAATGVALAAGIASLLLFVLHWLGIRPELEYLGLTVTGVLNGARIGHMSPLTAALFVLCVASVLASIRASGPRRAMAAFWLACLLITAGSFFLLAYVFGRPLLYRGSLPPPAFATNLAFMSLGIAIAATAGPQAWRLDGEVDIANWHYACFLALVFVLCASLLVCVGYFYVKDHEAQYRERAEHELSAIADLKVGELARWRAERLADAEVHFRNDIFSGLVRRALGRSSDAQTQLQIWLAHVREAYKYDNVVFTDAQGVVRMSAVKNVHHVDAIARAGAPGRPDRVLFLDFHRTEPDGPAHLTLVVPVLDAHKPGVLLGTLYLDIDPRKYLFPFIQRWPTTSRSAETLLVRRDGDDAQFLNTLRFQEDAPLSLRIPLTNSDVAAVKAVLGQEGIVEGVDYRGTAVIAALRKVPDSPWFLIARMDTAEALAPVRETLWLTSGLIGALLLAAAAAVGFAWRHQRVDHYKERVKAAEALAASMARHRAVTHSASFAIITADAEGRIVGWNPAAVRIFGYAEDEILGQMLAILMPERYRDRHRIGMQRVAGGWAQRMLFNTVELEGLTQAGEEFPMELSLSQWQAAEGVFFTGIVRDISQRRKTEAALRESETIFKYFMEFSPMYVFFKDENLRALRLSRNFEAMLGRPMEELLGKSMDELFPSGFAKSIVADDVRAMREGKSITLEEELNGRVFSTIKFPIIVEGKARYLAGFTADITERKRAQVAAQEANEQLRELTLRLNRVHEVESSLLSRELHDEFGQMLTRLKMDLALIASRLGEGSPDLRRRVESSLALVDESVQSVQSIASRLRPRILDELGLLPALDWLVQDFGERSGIDSEFVSNATAIALMPEEATAVFRIVQESLSNIARHADAKRIDVSLERQEGWLTVEIRDDGKGLREDEKTRHKSIGLLGMRERALAVGGELALMSVLKKGTLVRLRLPLATEQA